MTKKQPIPALAYIRCSTKKQGDADGPDRQRSVIEAFAARGGYAIEGWFEDIGVSGATEMENRHGFGQMLNAIGQRDIKVVLVERMDRLARDVVVGEFLILDMRKRGVCIYGADTGTDLTDGDPTNPTAKFIRQVLGAAAEFNKDIANLRMKAARESARKRGDRCEGRKPFGYYDGEKPAMERMLELKRGRMKPDAIAATLNAEGRVNRSGQPWTMSNVRKILAAHR